MAEGRARLEWAQTAEVLAILYNANRDSKKRSRPFTAAEFNPYAERPKDAAETATRITQENIGLLKSAFTGSPAAPNIPPGGKENEQ
jgi:hypothetical protein